MQAMPLESLGADWGPIGSYRGPFGVLLPLDCEPVLRRTRGAAPSGPSAGGVSGAGTK